MLVCIFICITITFNSGIDCIKYILYYAVIYFRIWFVVECFYAVGVMNGLHFIFTLWTGDIDFLYAVIFLILDYCCVYLCRQIYQSIYWITFIKFAPYPLLNFPSNSPIFCYYIFAHNNFSFFHFCIFLIVKLEIRRRTFFSAWPAWKRQSVAVWKSRQID